MREYVLKCNCVYFVNNTMQLILIVLFIILSNTCVFGSQCSLNLKTRGYTVPHGDILIEYGKAPLVIYCILNEDSENPTATNLSSLLSFNRKNHRLDDKYVTVLNSTTAMLRIDNMPISEDMYSCFFNEKELVCLNLVTVGRKPQNVTDFDCVGYNFENFTCEWSTSNETNVKSEFKLYYTHRNLDHFCVDFVMIRPFRFSCSWSLTTEYIYRLTVETFDLFLIDINEFGNVSSHYTIDHYSHVKSNPPQKLAVVNKTAFSIFLRWSIPRQMVSFLPGLQNSISYKSECDKSSDWTILYPQLLPKDNETFYYDVKHLIYAYTLYNFRISLAPALNISRLLWSEFTSIANRTSSTTPYIPKIAPDSYEIIKKLDSLVQVVLYWQRTHDCLKNGPDFKYGVTVLQKDFEVFKAETTTAYLMLNNLNALNDYTVNLISVNEFGQSDVMRINIVSEKKIISVPEDFIVVLGFGNGTYEISWRNITQVDNYTIYWCNHEDTMSEYTRCSGTLNWRVVGSNVTAINISLSSNDLYEFAVSAKRREFTTALVWSQCTVWAVNTVSSIKNVWINKVGATYLVVTWRLACLERIGFPKSITVSYCPIIAPNNRNCKEVEKNLTFDGEMLMYVTITGLTPYTTYKMLVKFTTQHGSTLKSDPLLNTTLESAPDSPANIKIIDSSINSTSFIITWQKPAVTNGLIRYYKLEIFDQKMNSVIQTKVNSIPNKTLYSSLLRNLISYTLYSVQVTACTVSCTHSALLEVRTLMDNPSQIVRPNVINNQSFVFVEWQQPQFPNGPLTFYELIVRYVSSGLHDEYNVTNATMFQFQSLVTEQCDTVEVQVRACNVRNYDHKYNEYSVIVRRKREIKESRYDEYFYGEWSPAGQTNLCHEDLISGKYYNNLVAIFSLVFIPLSLFLVIQMLRKCHYMNSILVKLPMNFSTSKVTASDYDFPMEILTSHIKCGNSEPVTIESKIDAIEESVESKEQSTSELPLKSADFGKVFFSNVDKNDEDVIIKNTTSLTTEVSNVQESKGYVSVPVKVNRYCKIIKCA